MNDVAFFQRTLAEGCLSDFALDKLAAAEGDAAQAAHLASCARCRQRARELDADAASARVPPFAPARRSAHVIRPLFAASTLLAAAAVLIVVTRPGDDVRTKGSDTIAVVRDGDGVQTLSAGDVLRPGDQIRFIADVSAPRAIIVLSPAGPLIPGPGEPVPVVGARTALEGAFVVDHDGSEERFGALLCAPNAAPSSTDALTAWTSDAALEGCIIKTLRFAKEARR